MFEPEVLIAFGLTLFVGMATGVGSAIAFFIKKPTPRFLAAALGFSGGVMIYVSLVEIFRKAETALNAALGSPGGCVGTFTHERHPRAR
jgi:ZIP family zinc transporter